MTSELRQKQPSENMAVSRSRFPEAIRLGESIHCWQKRKTLFPGPKHTFSLVTSAPSRPITRTVTIAWPENRYFPKFRYLSRISSGLQPNWCRKGGGAVREHIETILHTSGGP